MPELPDIPNLGQKANELAQKSSVKKVLLILPIVAGFLFLTDFVVIAALAMLSMATPIALRRMGIKQLGIEFVTLTTVLVALTMGPEAGALAGFFLMAEHMIAGQYSGAYLIWVIPGYAAAGFIAGVVSLPVTALGIGIAIGLNTVFTALTALVTPDATPYFLPHAVGNVVFNAALFIYLAPQLLTVI